MAIIITRTSVTVAAVKGEHDLNVHGKAAFAIIARAKIPDPINHLMHLRQQLH